MSNQDFEGYQPRVIGGSAVQRSFDRSVHGGMRVCLPKEMHV